jgi:hypothetical protein
MDMTLQQQWTVPWSRIAVDDRCFDFLIHYFHLSGSGFFRHDARPGVEHRVHRESSGKNLETAVAVTKQQANRGRSLKQIVCSVK